VSNPPVEYDEFGLFHENAEEFGIPYDRPPVVRRVGVEVAPGRTVSALAWGEGPPALVLLHGGAQNAHTWDTVALALNLPLLAIDLPGHGHSGPALASGLRVDGLAADVAEVVRQLAPTAEAVVGMSLGGLTTLALAAASPELVRRVVLVDITPGVNGEKSQAISSFVNGPATFPSFDELLERTMAFNPTRSEASLRRGILHNAVQRPDGTWVWRYRRFDDPPTGERPGGENQPADFGRLWDAVSGLRVPLLLVRGMRPQSVVDDADEAELRRRRPDATVVHVEAAGHSVQGDTPVELARLIAEFLRSPAG
jgi:pimeloyl-ACP methyl ester carboxylesterase